MLISFFCVSSQRAFFQTAVILACPHCPTISYFNKKEMKNMNCRRKPFSFCVFPGYRWCGPGCSGPGAPINDVDSCCYKHDLCLKRGNSPCYCDKKFMECLHSKRNPHTKKGRQANVMYNFMKLKTSFTCGHQNRC